MAVIFDLDQTLIDSHKALILRKERCWAKVYDMIPELYPYAGVSSLLHQLVIHNIPIAIVTTSPRPYCQKIIDHWQWAITTTVCYHDTQKHKPDPAPIILAAQRINVRTDRITVVGDSPESL